MTCEETGEDGLPQWHEAGGDQRTAAPLAFDTFIAYFLAGVRTEAEGAGRSLATPHEVVTMVTAEDLEKRQGGGSPMDVLARFSLPTVERLQCGTERVLLTGGRGEPLWLGQRTRPFSPAQRKAIAARDGGCAWPGCRAPVSWCDAHHVTWWVRDKGRTDVATASRSAATTTTSSTRPPSGRSACISESLTSCPEAGEVHHSPHTGCNDARSRGSTSRRSGGCDVCRGSSPGSPGRCR